jgi:hypothetical protein
MRYTLGLIPVAAVDQPVGYPTMAPAMIEAQVPELGANATTQPQAWYQNVLQTAVQGAQQYIVLKQQKELMDIQTQRLAQGLPPLDVSQYTPGMSVGMDSGTKRTLLIAAAIVGIALVARRR